jgi:hypothetical protein
MSAVDTHTATKRRQLPWMRMPNTTMPKAKRHDQRHERDQAPLVALRQRSTTRQRRGANALPQTRAAARAACRWPDRCTRTAGTARPCPRTMGEAVVGDALARGDRLLVNVVGHGEAARPHRACLQEPRGRARTTGSPSRACRQRLAVALGHVLGGRQPPAPAA